MRNYIIFSTLFCVFASDNLFYRSSFNNIDIRLYYFIFLINFFILFAKGSFELNRKHIIAIFVLIVSGIIGILIDPLVLPRFLMSIWGISFVSIYYYVFFRKTKVSYVYLFKLYTIGCIIFSIIGYCEVLFYILTENQLPQFNSFATEASVYCTLILPAFYYFLQRFLNERRNIIQLLCLLISILLSFSSLGYIGILISLILSVKKWRPLIIVPIAGFACLSLFLIYNISEKFQSRVDSAISIVNQKDDLSGVKAMNQSSFFLLANSYVALNSAKNTYGLGHGLGSHSATYKRTIESLLNVSTLSEDYQRSMLDASSLFNRILSDLGYWGIAATVLFLRKYRIKDPGIHQIISRAILVTIFCRLIRDGRYFNADLFFFLSGYIVIYLEKYGFTKKSIN